VVSRVRFSCHFDKHWIRTRGAHDAIQIERNIGTDGIMKKKGLKKQNSNHTDKRNDA